MDEIYVQSQVYPNFEGYIINKNKSVARYEYNSSEPINCHLGKSKMSTCACGGSVVPLAYVFETEKEKSNILLGKKCTKCGNNYFTEKTISLFPSAFNIEDVQCDEEEQESILNNSIEKYNASVRQALYGIYEQIFLIAYDKGIDLSKIIQEVSLEIDTLKTENTFDCEPEGYIGLWMVQSIANKLHIPVNQLFVLDKELKKRVVEDILCVAINSKDNMDIDFIDENHPESAVQIEFPINRLNSFCTRQDVDIYCAELMNFRVTNELPNNEKVFSKYLVRFCKGNGMYSICLSGKASYIQTTSYIYDMVEIYSEEHGRLEKIIEECIEFKMHNLSDKNQAQIISDNECISIPSLAIPEHKKDTPMQTMGRELPETKLDNRKETELVAAVYDTTRTMDILNKFEGLEENSKPYERLVISNGVRGDISSKYWLHYVIERSKNRDYVGDITFTNFKLGHVRELWNHIKEELKFVNVEDYVDKDVYIKFEKPFHLRAQNKRNRTGYGWEWNWSSGYGDYTEGTLYGETTDYVFAGVYISSGYTYEQAKRKKSSAKVNSGKKLEDEQVNYYKLAVDGYVNGEYTLIVSSSSPSFKSKNKRIQLFIKAERAGKNKYVPVACDTTDKLLYMNRATFDYYRAQINRQHPLVLYKTYVD